MEVHTTVEHVTNEKWVIAPNVKKTFTVGRPRRSVLHSMELWSVPTSCCTFQWAMGRSGQLITGQPQCGSDSFSVGGWEWGVTYH